MTIVRIVAIAVAAIGWVGSPAASIGPAHAAGPEGTMTWGIHVTLPARWLDPMEPKRSSPPSWSSTLFTMPL